MTTRRRLPKLPELLNRKFYKTGQTRGADDSQIYQNRVSRASTVLIPYSEWTRHEEIRNKALNNDFENGYIVLISPDVNFSKHPIDPNLILGTNALVFYQIRTDWNLYNPEQSGLNVATNRATNPATSLGGEYVARIAATTSSPGERSNKIYMGYTTTQSKGAGIRLYEYASIETIKNVRLQMEAIFWMTTDADIVMEQTGMTALDIQERKEGIFLEANKLGLLDETKLIQNRIINNNRNTVCPLCLEEISTSGFITRMAQAEGREVHDLTITENNLFHIQELRFNEYNHKVYNLGWGHHHCNVVVKDSGIQETLEWMRQVLNNNMN